MKNKQNSDQLFSEINKICEQANLMPIQEGAVLLRSAEPLIAQYIETRQIERHARILEQINIKN